MNVIDNRTFT